MFKVVRYSNWRNGSAKLRQHRSRSQRTLGPVELRDIKVGRDFGTTIEIVQRVAPSDRVIRNPADSLVTGDVIQIAATPPSSPAVAVAKK